MAMGWGDLFFLLDLAAYITLFFFAKGWKVKGGKTSYLPLIFVPLAVIVSIVESALFGFFGAILGVLNFLLLFVYFAGRPEHILGFFKDKPFLLVASIPLLGTFVGFLVIYLSSAGGIPIIRLLLSVVGFSIILLSKGLLVSLTAEVLERGGINRYWSLLFSFLGYIGLLLAVLIVRRREEV